MLKPFTVFGQDGELGTVDDLYFDDEKWTGRYVVVNSNRWLPGKKLFVSPASISEFTLENESLYANINKEEAKKSPSPEEEPVTRKFESQFSQYYGLNPYWMGPGLWGSGMIARDLAQEKIDGSVVDYQEEESHAMSVNVVIGYEIATRDESFGKVKDVLVEEDSFKIRYFIVDTNHWLPGGKEVLISTDWIDDVNWHQSILSVNLTKDQVENAPELIDDEPINREMEERVFKHYGKPKYWD